METTLKENTNAQKLGFKKLETAEVVSNLNRTLCSYQVFFHKLQNFHWNIVGTDFFDVHEITQELYEKTLKNIDDIAERIRVFGQVPVVKLSEYVSQSIIEESDPDKSAEMMFYALISDIEKLTELFLAIHESASKYGDVGTTHMCGEYIKELETYHWQLSAWTKKYIA